MLCAKIIRHLARVGQLAEACNIKANSKRLHRTLAKLAHGANDDTRIQAAAQKRAYRHIADHALFDSAANMLAHTREIRRGCGGLAAFERTERKFPVAFFAHASSLLIKQEMPWLHFVDIFEESSRSRHIAYAEKVGQRLKIDLTTHAWIAEKCFNLRGKQQVALDPRIVKWLFPNRSLASNKHLLRPSQIARP